MVLTPNMDLTLPVVGVTSGAEGITQIIEAIEVIDEHDHTSSKGVKITQAGLNITGNLDLNSNHLTEVSSVRCTDQSTTLSTNEDKDSFYFVSGNFYINNGDGVPVKITDGTGINLSSIGTIGGDYGAPGIDASVIYTDLTKTFTFTQSTGVGSKLATGDILLYETTTSPQPTIIQSASGISTPAIITMPSLTGTLSTINLAEIISGSRQFNGVVNFNTVTASQVLAVDSSKNLVSLDTTGSNKVVKDTSPTISAPTLTGNINLSGQTANYVIALDGSKNITSIATTGTGSIVKADAPAFSGVPTGTITSGSYTPTMTDDTSRYTTTNYATGYYQRIGNIVNVTITYKMSKAAGGGADTGTVRLKATLPIASNFTTGSDAFGYSDCTYSTPDLGDYIVTNFNSGRPSTISADASTDKVTFERTYWSGSDSQLYIYGTANFKYIVK